MARDRDRAPRPTEHSGVGGEVPRVFDVDDDIAIRMDDQHTRHDFG
jgi:hypothetical protein